MEGLPAVAPEARAKSWPERLRSAVQRVSPGASIAVLVALAAAWLSDHYGAPVMLFALLLGMAVNFAGQDKRMRPGIDFMARTVLRLGVALLGARITLEQAAALGGPTLAMATVGVALTLGAGWVAARVLKLTPNFGLLAGGAVGICGASAALAISSVLPPTPERERDTMLTVVGVTALSTVAMILYPMLAAAIGLSEHQAGILMGATIHDVAQVVGAGYGIGKEAGDTATIVKLFRVALLLPVVLLISLIFRAQLAAGPRTSRPPLLPTFLIGFVLLVAVNSTGLVPRVVTGTLSDASRWCLVAAIAALGAKTALGDLVKVGPKPVLTILAATLLLLAFTLTVLLLSGG
ncbi:putative sulfate exporter family transporter [Sandaracinobacteroides saxicola]|uniref:Putative sulfate exporter family transporter n=2 Tax=Sandaracinobacteroides saxicola TaxID=2759707 RepID=A0A7G5IMG9_9SPHN|nr:putative sulfate exporter family transporter [Sandaracinobacteroides saxicola]